MTFIETLKAYIKGDDESIKSLKIQKKAKSLLKIEIANIDNAIIKQQDAIENAEEKLKEAKMNFGSTEFNDDEYVNTIVKHRNNLTEAQEKLENFEEHKIYLEELLKEVSE